jgi:hypothetical protein
MKLLWSVDWPSFYTMLCLDMKRAEGSNNGTTDTTDIVTNPLNPGIFRNDFDQYSARSEGKYGRQEEKQRT